MARQLVELGFSVNERDDVGKTHLCNFLTFGFRVALRRCTEQLDTVERKWPSF